MSIAAPGIVVPIDEGVAAINKHAAAHGWSEEERHKAEWYLRYLFSGTRMKRLPRVSERGRRVAVDIYSDLVVAYELPDGYTAGQQILSNLPATR